MRPGGCGGLLREPAHALLGADDVRESDAKLVVDDHRLSARYELVVDAHVERLASNTLTTNRRDVRACMCG